MSAELEFHWPKTLELYSRRLERPVDTKRPPSLIDATEGLTVASHHSAECERVLRGALDRIVELEDALRAAEGQLADSSSAVEVQQTHIDFLNTKLRERRHSRKRASRH